MQRDLVSSFKGFVNPPVLFFVIAFDFERLRIDQDLFFDGGMRAIILEFPRPVAELCGRGKDFHNETWRLDACTLPRSRGLHVTVPSGWK
jgi:hypothetical protein